MKSARLEAFSDGVMAIIVTIMVLELKVPHSAEPQALIPLIPVFISYIMSFIFVWIYWNNHHHLFQTVRNVNGKVLLANGLLLFCLSLSPFVTAWMGENHFAEWPVFTYGVVMAFTGMSWNILTSVLLKIHPEDSSLAKAISRNKKGIVSFFLYLAGVGISLFIPLAAVVIYFSVSVMWLIPDKKIEEILNNELR